MAEVFAPLVFCRACNRRVEDCEHCVYPITAPRVPVMDEKVESLAYAREERILEITFRNGQVWQLSHVPEGLYNELRESTISPFLRFLSQRYQASPVKTGVHAIQVPDHETCAMCHAVMTSTHRASGDQTIRVQWTCGSCKTATWRTYGNPPTRMRRSRLR